MSEKPIIFVDIDGVLNAFARRNGQPKVWPDEKLHRVSVMNDVFIVRLSVNMAQSIQSLGDVVWTTTWQHHADLIGDIVGIDADYLPLGFGWKRRAVEDYLADNPRPWVWFEDEPGEYGTYNEKHFDYLPDGLVINTDPSKGVTPENIATAREWIKENT